jgi:hypothetical protein
MSKGTNTGTGRKRVGLVDRAYARAWVNYPYLAKNWERLAYSAGYLAGWRAAKREGKR